MALPLWAQFIAALAPALAVIAASTAALIAWRAHARQKRSDSQERFWNRVTWAIDMTQADNVSHSGIGLIVLRDLLNDRQLIQDDARLLEKLAQSTAELVALKQSASQPEHPPIEVVKRIPNELRGRYTEANRQGR